MKNLIIIFSLSIFYSCDFAPGSYPYAEIYKYDVRADSAIKEIIGLKTIDKSLRVPTSVGLKDGKQGHNDYWYHIYFFDQKYNQIFNTWIREESDSTCNFALVGVNKGLKLGNWKRINKDYGTIENGNKKKEFKHLVLDKLNIRRYDK